MKENVHGATQSERRKEVGGCFDVEKKRRSLFKTGRVHLVRARQQRGVMHQIAMGGGKKKKKKDWCEKKTKWKRACGPGSLEGTGHTTKPFRTKRNQQSPFKQREKGEFQALKGKAVKKVE